MISNSEKLPLEWEGPPTPADRAAVDTVRYAELLVRAADTILPAVGDRRTADAQLATEQCLPAGAAIRPFAWRRLIHASQSLAVLSDR